MEQIIRVATLNDQNALMEMEFELFKKWDSMDEIDNIEGSWFLSENHRDKVVLSLKNPLKKIYLAEINGKIVAYLKAEIMEREPFLKKVGYISEMLVLPEYRGKTIGTKLLNEALLWFRKNKLAWTTVSTHSSDLEANSFWEKNGYREFNKFFKMRL